MNVPSLLSPVCCTPPRFRFQSTLIAVLLPFAAAGSESAVEHGVRERTPLYWMNDPSSLSQRSKRTGRREGEYAAVRQLRTLEPSHSLLIKTSV